MQSNRRLLNSMLGFGFVKELGVKSIEWKSLSKDSITKYASLRCNIRLCEFQKYKDVSAVKTYIRT